MNLDLINQTDFDLIRQISHRAAHELSIDKLSTEMDLCATHIESPLRLNDFLNADKFNFAHDIFGIANNLNRETERLENFFSPRFTKH